MLLFGSNLWICFSSMCNLGYQALSLKMYCCFNKEPLCFYVWVYSRRPQTLAVICRNMGICDVFRAVATGENLSRFYLIPWDNELICEVSRRSICRTHARIYITIYKAFFSDAVEVWHSGATTRNGFAKKQLLESITQIARTLGSTSIRYRSDTFASDRYLIDADPKVFAV